MIAPDEAAKADSFAALAQGSDEWLRARLGRVTASRIADLLARTKSGGVAASRKNYLAELLAERLTGLPGEHWRSAAMQWGNDVEPQARAAYESERALVVVPGGFVLHPAIPMAGASPDGLVGADGLVQIKCPNTMTHVDTYLSRTAPSKYLAQMQWELACTGRAWCDFASFDPRLHEGLRLFIVRVARDAKRIAELEVVVRAFLLELDDTEGALRAIAGPNAGLDSGAAPDYGGLATVPEND